MSDEPEFIDPKAFALARLTAGDYPPGEPTRIAEAFAEMME